MGRLISELLLWQHTHTDTHTQTRQQYKQTQFIQSLVNEHVTQGQRAALRPQIQNPFVLILVVTQN